MSFFGLVFTVFISALCFVAGVLFGRHNPVKSEEYDAKFNEFRKRLREELAPYLDKLDEAVKNKIEELFK